MSRRLIDAMFDCVGVFVVEVWEGYRPPMGLNQNSRSGVRKMTWNVGRRRADRPRDGVLRNKHMNVN